MGRLTGPPITASDKEWILKQKIFFVGSAPLDENYHVNISPKSAMEFRVIDETHVAWLDYSGSGAETAAHILENGRLTIMFVALTGDPKIMRLYGKGSLVMPEAVQRAENIRLQEAFKGQLLGDDDCDNGFRSITVLEVHRVTQSCGYSIPFFDYVKDRLVLKEFTQKKGHEGMVTYRGFKNSLSIDGLKSIGQLEARRAPTRFEHKDGYYLSYYDDTGNWLSRAFVHVFMLSRSFLVKKLVRDVFMICIGIVLCSLWWYITQQDACPSNL